MLLTKALGEACGPVTSALVPAPYTMDAVRIQIISREASDSNRCTAIAKSVRGRSGSSELGVSCLSTWCVAPSISAVGRATVHV